MKRVLIVGSQHGNEPLGELLYGYVRRQPWSSEMRITYILANPRARRRNVRYMESDMNRSFGSTGDTTYEQRQAHKLLAYIGKHPFDLIIDAHTTTVDQPACMIVHGITDDNSAFLRASHIKNVVVMKHTFVRQSLIGNAPRAVSVEVSNSQLGTPLFATLYQDLVAYVRSRSTYPQKDVFVVEDVLKKGSLSAAEAEALKNFKKSADGYYPVLVGEDAYRQQTDYLGFIARSKQKVTV